MKFDYISSIIKIAVGLSLISGSIVSAAPISQSQAEAVALNYSSENFSGAANLIPGETKMSKNADQTSPLWYVVNLSDRFVLVSGDDCTTPVLGYSDSGSFDESNIPPQMQWLLSGYEEQLKAARSAELSGDATVGKEWKDLSSDPAAFVPRRLGMGKNANVSPLLGTICWDQGEGWNSQCPSDSNGPGGHCRTGCVATAMSMIMKYYQWPSQGVGTHSYTPSGYSMQTVNYGATTYNWSAMPATASSAESAKLLYHAGVSVNMMYSSGVSNAYGSLVSEAMRTHFRYESGEMQVRDDSETNASWNNKILTELQANRPVLYGGQSSSGGGHCFVVDGYNGSQFHVNWGWSGHYNGYFSLSALAPGNGSSYTLSNSYIPGLSPDKGGSSSYTVSFNANGGSGTMSSQTFTAGVSQALNLNTFTRSGYTFAGWNTNSAGTGTSFNNGETVLVSANATLYAQWTSSSMGTLIITTAPSTAPSTRGFTLTCASGTGIGETGIYNVTLPVGSTYNIVFNNVSGWVTPESVSGTVKVGTTYITGTYTQVPTYTVSFNSNGGSGSMSSQTFTAGVSQALNLNTFTRNGFAFAGWNTNSGGTGTSYSNGQSISVSSNMTLYAKWAPDNGDIIASLTSPADGSGYDFSTISSLTFGWNWTTINSSPFKMYFGTSSTGSQCLAGLPISDPSITSCNFSGSMLQTVKEYCGVSGAGKIYWWLGVEVDSSTYMIISDVRSFYDAVGFDINCIGGDFSAGTVTPLAPGGALDFKWDVNTNNTFGSAQQFWCEAHASKTGGFDLSRLGGTVTQSHVQSGLPAQSNPLNPGNQLLNTIPDGRYTLVPVVNHPARPISTTETDFTNNWVPIAGKRLSVRNTTPSGVDLVLQNTGVEITGTDGVTVSTQVRNAGGSAMTGAGCWLEVFYGYINAEGDIVPEGRIGPGQLVSGLGVGATASYTLNGNVPGGVENKALYVLVDGTDIIPEPNKVNNSYLWYSPSILPPGKSNGIDLEITNMTISNTQLAPTYQVKPGDKLNYSVTIKNNGATLSTPVWLELFGSQDGCGSRVRGASLTESQYLTMPTAGQSKTYQLSQTINSIGDGMYSVMAIVNRDGLTGNPGDMMPLNNRYKFSGGRISLATPTGSGSVNLTWQTIPTFSYSSAAGTMTITGTVINTGSSTSRSFWIEPFVGYPENQTGIFVNEGPLTGGTYCAGLAPGATQYVSTTGYVGKGKVVGILIDGTDLVAETDETDNYDYSELTK